MRTRRIFVDMPLAEGERIMLPPATVHRVGKVLRLRPGDEVELFDGRGGAFAASVVSMARGEVAVETGGHDPSERESPLRITLVQGISRGQHMDYTLQKAVELGVSRIAPVFTLHGNVRLDGERLARRIDHWRGIIIGACEQCGRNRLPDLAPPVRLSEWAAADSAPLRLVLDPAAPAGLGRAAPRAAGSLSLLCGPEGGLSGEEIAAARGLGWLPVRLGPRVLRTETAAVAAIAACQSLWGDLAENR